MKNKKIIIAGGTGFMGQALARFFARDNHVVILSRQSVNDLKQADPNLLRACEDYNITYWRWDGKTLEKHWAKEIDGADLVINLAGKSVNCRYSDKNKKEIFDSRLHSTEVIGEAIRRAVVPPKLWINAASATIYRHTEDQPNDEFSGLISDLKSDNMPYSFLNVWRTKFKRWLTAIRYGKNSEQYFAFDKDFSVQVCHEWEHTFFNERSPFTRKIALRTAIALGQGGVMKPYFNLLKCGLGGHHGDGKQWYSWVHMEDVARSIEWFWDHPALEGVFNCSAPAPVTNRFFMDTLKKLTGHSFGLPAPKWLLEIGAALIGTETELILKSRKVLPARLMKTGFQFSYPILEDALKEIVQKTPRSAYHFF